MSPASTRQAATILLARTSVTTARVTTAREMTARVTAAREMTAREMTARVTTCWAMMCRRPEIRTLLATTTRTRTNPPRSGWAGRGQDDDDDEGRPAGAWPALPGLPPVIPPAFARAGDWRPAAGLLDLSLPWQVLAGTSPGPGYLGRIGPLTADQARRLATCAARDPGAEWRIIVTTSGGQAIAVTRIPSPRDGPRQPAGGTRPGAGIGLVSRVTLTIPQDILTHPPPLSAAATGVGPDQSGRILYLALRAAGRAAARARAAATADAAAGGCAHTSASPGYRPPPRLKEYIAARDLTCRYPICRQPAWRGDLDTPFRSTMAG